MIDVKYFRRWYFYVQMVGYEEEAQCYSMEMTICRPDEGEADSFITKYQIISTDQDPGGNTLRGSPEISVRWR